MLDGIGGSIMIYQHIDQAELFEPVLNWDGSSLFGRVDCHVKRFLIAFCWVVVFFLGLAVSGRLVIVSSLVNVLQKLSLRHPSSHVVIA